MGLESESRRGYTESLLQPGPTEPMQSRSKHRDSHPAHNRVVIKHQVPEISSVAHCVFWLLINATESSSSTGRDQSCSAQTQQALYCGFIHLHWYNLAGAYSEGILIPEETVFMEPGCFYGVKNLGLSFLLLLTGPEKHWSSAVLRSVRHSWFGPSRKRNSCTVDTSCISELHPGVLHLHSSPQITAIPVHQLGKHIFLLTASLGL